MTNGINYNSSFYNNAESRTAGRMPIARGISNQNTALTKEANNDGGGGFFSFIKSFIDIINPLQHIPIVGNIYRNITGDQISPGARIAGSTLYGGPIGGITALAKEVYTESNTPKTTKSVALDMSHALNKYENNRYKPRIIWRA